MAYLSDESFGTSCSEHVDFDETFKTFRITCGKSLYAFAISSDLSLEHLYWGRALQPGYDLRYLSRSGRTMHFNTTEARIARPMVVDNLSSQLQAESLEELNEVWRRNKEAGRRRSTSDPAFLQSLRLNNLAARIMNKPVALPQPLMTMSRSASTELSDFDSSEFFADLDTPLESIFESPRRLSRLPPRSPSSRQISEAFSSALAAAPEGRPEGRSRSMSRQSSLPSSRAASPTRARVVRSFEQPKGNTGKGSICLEYSDHGTGDFRAPSFLVTCADGSSISPLRYKRHFTVRGKPSLPDHLPGIRCNEDSASTLVVVMRCARIGLEVHMLYTSLHEHDAIVRRVEFHHCGDQTQPITILKASSVSVDLESDAAPFHMVQLSGSWGRERSVVETRLTHGIQSFGSTRGVSSHQHNPFVALAPGPLAEGTGEVKAFTLVYSGNFLVEAELNEFNRLRLNVGINPMEFSWRLCAGEVFSTPEVLLVRSDEGLGGVSRTQHRIINDMLVPRTWAYDCPPVLINTWEALYFEVSYSSVIELAHEAVKVGCDLLCIDDGWFGERSSIFRGLGDWTVNEVKFPYDLASLGRELNAMGVRLGIWLEPEMVSEDSALFAAHPDWCFHVPGLAQQLGRNQLVLDITRKEVRDHIFDTLSALLRSANIEYVKWDMNRPLTEVFTLRDGARQRETSHRFVLGLYELQQRLQDTFPHVLLENCASGGGRFDAGMLYFSPQIWCSDNTDALSRLKIQYGTSLAYPARSIGALISSCPNHITGNSTRARTRGFVAMCGTMGFTVDFGAVSTTELLACKEAVRVFRRIWRIILNGDLYRLWNPFKALFAAWMYVSRDKSEAVVFAFSFNSECWSNLVPRLLLNGLLRDEVYQITEPIPNNLEQRVENLRIAETKERVFQLGYKHVYFTGEMLMSAGLPVRFYAVDDSIMFRLRVVPPEECSVCLGESNYGHI